MNVQRGRWGNDCRYVYADSERPGPGPTSMARTRLSSGGAVRGSGFRMGRAVGVAEVGPAAMAGLMLWLDAISDTIHPDAEEPGPRGARHLPEPG